MSCDHDLANEWAHCSEKNVSYITIDFIPVLYIIFYRNQLRAGCPVARTVGAVSKNQISEADQVNLSLACSKICYKTENKLIPEETRISIYSEILKPK